MLIIDRVKALWFTLFVVLLCVEQFIGGVAMLRFDFWHSTYVIYGSAARVANAADLGIIAAGLALDVFAVVWVGLLVAIKKDSPLNVLTHVWTSLILLLVFETIALLIVMFGEKDSPLNVLTHVWTSLILLLVFETIALLIVMFGGLLTVV